MAAKHEIQRLLASTRALSGLGASLPGYRANRPTAGQEESYAALVSEVNAGCAILSRDTGEPFVNPCSFSDLFAFWSWVWGSEPDGKSRTKAAVNLFEEFTAKVAEALERADDEATGDRPALDRHVEASFAAGGDFTIINIDLDKFKQLNDSQGHAAGDACIATVLSTIETVGRGRGRAFRQGGDEFALVLRNCTAREGAACAERLRTAIEIACRAHGVTASVGVAATDLSPKAGGPELQVQADKAMYLAKQSGGNAVRTAEGS